MDNSNVGNKRNMLKNNKTLDKKRNTVAATFMIRQLVEKSVEYNKPKWCYKIQLW